ncbi:hypothetical protein GCM10011371_18370 [Novosphingobium marinum]|uniref:UPF0391 membrane protein FHS75_002278 n=1 Tax=Novosphingobium marinum TaxID=1514948 RepID=A0A7Y9XWQ1_9SPHN|nr:DUF1328 family protein [Novosphingobium marinum]NYH95949.1 uncharacterized membrane protein YtjA (UPF0391 family) [Novosphingobium marinum]GGC31269.1 hypothetical protein GCM10011371_18370 [Novosphingobium marinum]
MLEILLMLLAVAAIASFFGFGRLSGAALTGAKIIVVVALVVFLLVLLGVIAIA